MRDSEKKALSRRDFGKAAAAVAGLSLVPSLMGAALQSPNPKPETPAEIGQCRPYLVFFSKWHEERLTSCVKY